MSDSSVVVAFEGGLDMVTPVQDSAPGSLVQCLNYEVGPIKGYKRIDGYERFDGSTGGGISNLYVVDLRPLNPAFTIVPGDIIERYGKLLATVMSVDGDTVYYVPAIPGNKISMLVAGYRVVHTNGNSSSVIAESPTQDFRDVAADYDEYINEIYSVQNALRSQVVSAPRPIAGVYYGRTQAYAVVDMYVLNMANASDTLTVGEYVRIGTWAYRVAAVDGHVVWLQQLFTPMHSSVSDVRVVTQAEAFTGAGSGLSTITGAIEETSEDLRLYAQPYIVDAGYTPVQAALTIQFENGDTAFGEDVRLSDGTNYMGLKVVGYRIDEGGFGTSDAKGVLYAYGDDFTTSSAGFAGTFSGALTLTDTAALTIADVTAVSTELWAGTHALRDTINKRAQTFYQWGTYNFKATEGNEMVFCTTGCSKAGWIAELETGFTYYGTITTNPDDPESDIPKYLAFHAGQRLALGFANGSLQLSAVSNPLNFSGFEGALEIGNGDNITGLLEASGDSTLIFGPRSIRRLIGEGTNLALRTISSETGARDYTACVVAGVPLYVNHNGLCTLDQTSAYGDFKNSAISGSIDPFFTPRIIEDSSSVELGGTVCAFPVRTKNQYRLFLGDGSVVSMSITPIGAQPMLGCYQAADTGLRLPFAYSSSVSDDGHEYLLVVWDALKAAEDTSVDTLPPDDMIYRLDNGWGFDGLVFNHYIDTSYMFNQNPTFLTIDKAVLYGMGYGAATLRLRAAGIEDDFSQSFDSTVQDISMPRNPDILYKQLDRVMGIVDHANWGRAIKLRFENITEAGSTLTEPPHILQSVRLFVQTEGIPEN